MKKSILNSFKRNALEQQLQKFYTDFAEKSASGNALDEAEIESLKNMYDSIITTSREQFEKLQQATGISFAGSDTTSQNSLSGAVQSITQDQADLLAGQFGG